MFMTLLALIIVGATAYVWCTRGFFSALLHMMCVIAAGAIAFGVWEPLGYLLLSKAPQRGVGSFLSDVPFSITLVVPFALSLALLRAVVDKILPANAQCDTVSDYIGGGVCGLVAGIITAGIVVLGIGMLRVKPDFGGYQAAVYSTNANGSISRTPQKLIPWVDRLTAGFYEHVSLTTMRTGSPLARYHPDLDFAVAANRLTYEGKSRTGIRKGDFSLIGWFTVGDGQDAFAKPQPFSKLTVDYRQDRPQKIVDINEEDFGSGALVGYIVRFNATAREQSGTVVIGNGQVRLVCESVEEEDFKTVFPISIISRVNDPTRRHYGRFRCDSNDFFVASVGGEAESVLGFEFPVPQNFRPVALYVRGVRVPVEELDNPQRFATPSDRDNFITSGQMEGMQDVGPILDERGQQVQAPPDTSFRQDPVRVTNALGFTIQKGTERTLRVAEEGRSGYAIQEGEVRMPTGEGRSGVIDAKLRIDRFSTTPDTVLVQVDFTPRNRTEEIARALESADRSQPPVLIDTNGSRFQAVGFVYKDQTMNQVRYTRGQPIGRMQDLPSVTRNTPSRSLVLLFVVSRGVDVRELRIGNDTIESYNPVIRADSGR
jgi:hypothetical protein